MLAETVTAVAACNERKEPFAFFKINSCTSWKIRGKHTRVEPKSIVQFYIYIYIYSSGKILLHYLSLFTVTTLWGSKNEVSTVIDTRAGCGLNVHNPRMQNAAFYAHVCNLKNKKTPCLFMGNGYSNWKKAASKDSGSRQVKMSRSATGICVLFHFNWRDPSFEGKLGPVLTKTATTEQKINLT